MRRCIAMLGFAIFLFTGCSKDVDNSPPGDLQAQGELINLLKDSENLTSNFVPIKYSEYRNFFCTT